jgi:iron complex outermembrane receptor protein
MNFKSISAGLTRLHASTAVAALAIGAIPAHAQVVAEQAGAQTPAASATEARDEDTILVTARRTEERLQDVPVAVTVFSSQALREQRVVSEIDLQIATPGLTVRQTGSSDQLNFAIRGQSIDSFSNSAPAVVAYFNDVPAGGGNSTALFDLSSVQVLKGPQGTLFGRNATGGAVLYNSAPPTHDLEGYIKADYGNFDNKQVEGAVNVPIGDSLAIRLSGFYRNRDGFQTNLLTGEKANSIDAVVGRVSFLIEPPSGGFKNVLVMQYGDFGGKTGATKIQNAYGVNGAPSTYFDPLTGTTRPLATNSRDIYGVGGPGAGVVPGFTSIGDFLTKQKNIGFYEFYGNTSNFRDGEQTLVTNTTSIDVGEANLKAIVGYNKVIQRESTDIDGGPYEFLLIGGGPGPEDFGYTFGTEQLSGELQLSGKTGALTYIVGAFISHDKVRNRIPLYITRDLGAPFVGPYDFTIGYKSKALYGQLTYALTDKVNLTGGLRYTWEDVDIVQAADSLLFGINGERKDSKPSWLVGIDYRVSDDLMVYFNHRGSWRTGGFNGASLFSAPNASTFKPETTYDFELGAKYSGYIGNTKTVLNLAVFDQYIKDVQRAPYLDFSALAGNVNRARVSGAEFDGSINPTEWLQIGGTLAYTNARFTDPLATVGTTSFVFGPYADTPEWAGSAYARLGFKLDDGSEASFRAQYYSQSSFFYSNLADTILPLTQIDGYSLINLRAEWSNISGTGLTAAAYVQNLTNEKYFVGGFPLGAVIGSNATLLGTPRMYGVELRFDF